MNSYDAELHILRQKDMARAAGNSYPTIAHLVGNESGLRLTYRRALAGVGGRLVAIGYRLQGEFDHLAAPELADSLGLGGNSPCVEC